jgi:hypothetical protein
VAELRRRDEPGVPAGCGIVRAAAGGDALYRQWQDDAEFETSVQYAAGTLVHGWSAVALEGSSSAEATDSDASSDDDDTQWHQNR